jgi:deoxycytidine triphosphate deaminase
MFSLFRSYVDQVTQTVADHIDDPFTDPDDLVPKLRLLLTQFKAIHRAFDELFSRDNREVTQALSYFVNEACIEWNISSVDIAITVGGPGNFVTRSTPFWASMFSSAASNASRDILSVAIPEHEGTMTRWVPIVLGHELAHHLITHHQVPGLADIESRINNRLIKARQLAADSESPASFADEWWTDEIAHAWVEELVCDAYSVALFGPAAVAAGLEFLTSLGDPTKATNTHPPTCFRATLMMEWLGPNISAGDQPILTALQTNLESEQPSAKAVELCEAIREETQAIKDAVNAWSKVQLYDVAARQNKIDKLSDLLGRGVPGALTTGADYDIVDIVNSCWRAGGSGTKYPTDKLASKAVDDLYFVQSWQAAGGAVASHASSEPSDSYLGVLTKANFLQRVNSGRDDELAMTPLLPGALGPASVDLRLSNRFIVFEQTSNAAFDALQAEQDPRRMQSRVQKSWGDPFYLHPGQLVLAATLEYIVMPNDLCAQVVTRSSYGRLGLLSATAVQVHPAFKGCLTLELVNLGSMPIAITPGERVAQLMIFPVASPYTSDETDSRKYNCPIGPEFSKIKQDTELGTLRNMREHFGAGDSPPAESGEGNK